MKTSVTETLDVVEKAHKARDELSKLTDEEKRKYLRTIKKIEKLLDEDKVEEAAHILIRQSDEP